MSWKNWSYTLSNKQKGLLIGFIFGVILLALYRGCNYGWSIFSGLEGRENSFCNNYLVANIITFPILVIGFFAIIIFMLFYYLFKINIDNLGSWYSVIFIIVIILFCFSLFGFFIGSKLDRRKIKKLSRE